MAEMNNIIFWCAVGAGICTSLAACSSSDFVDEEPPGPPPNTLLSETQWEVVVASDTNGLPIPSVSARIGTEQAPALKFGHGEYSQYDGCMTYRYAVKYPQNRIEPRDATLRYSSSPLACDALSLEIYALLNNFLKSGLTWTITASTPNRLTLLSDDGSLFVLKAVAD